MCVGGGCSSRREGASGRAGERRLVPRRAPPDCFPAQSCQPAQASCGSVRLSRRMGGGERRGRFAPLPGHAFPEAHWLPSFGASPGWASAHAIGPRLSRRNAPFPVGPAPPLAAPFPSFLSLFPPPFLQCFFFFFFPAVGSRRRRRRRLLVLSFFPRQQGRGSAPDSSAFGGYPRWGKFIGGKP